LPLGLLVGQIGFWDL